MIAIGPKISVVQVPGAVEKAICRAIKMGIITPDTPQSERPGDYFICPHCGGSGYEP